MHRGIWRGMLAVLVLSALAAGAGARPSRVDAFHGWCGYQVPDTNELVTCDIAEITYGAVITGEVKWGNQGEADGWNYDIWTFSGTQGDVVEFAYEILSTSKGVGPALTLEHDETTEPHTPLPARIDTWSSSQDGVRIFELPETGDYALRVRVAASGLDQKATYRLTVREDHVAPAVRVKQSTAPSAKGWHRGMVRTTISATDNLAGVTEVGHWLNSDGNRFPVAGTSTSFKLTSEGVYNWGYWATDAFGNVASANATGNLADTLAQIKIDLTPPTVTPVAIDFSPTPLVASSVCASGQAVRARLGWTGADSPSGILRYEVQKTTNGGGTWTALTSTVSGTVTRTTGTAAAINLCPDTSYAFRVRSQDNSGRYSAWSEPGWTAPEVLGEEPPAGHDTPTYSRYGPTRSHWTSATVAKAGSTATVRRSNVTGATASFDFHGIGVVWMTIKQPSAGNAIVALYRNNGDGTRTEIDRQTVNLYASATSLTKVGYTRSGLPFDSYTLEIAVEGTLSAPSTNTFVFVDGFVVLH